MAAKANLLKNNILLITENNSLSRSCSIGFWFNIGSRDENEDEYGITHFTEHMLFKGTKNLSTHEISLSFDKLGGNINAFTDRESVCVYCTIPVDEKNCYTDKALDVISEMISSSVFKEDEFLREKEVIKNEISTTDDDVEESALDKLVGIIWKNKKFSHSITGNLRNVKSISRDRLFKWYKKYISKGELCIIITGRIEEKRILQKIATFTKHKKGIEIKYPRIYKKNINLWNQGSVYRKSGFTQNQVFIVYPIIMCITEKNYYALNVFNTLFGDTMSSRLFDTLREKYGLCYSVYSYFECYKDVGIWYAYSSCERNVTSQVREMLKKEISNLFLNKITEQEVEASKVHLCGEEIINSEDNEYKMKRLYRNYFLGFPLRDTDGTIECINKITLKDVENIIISLFSNGECNKNRAVITYGERGKK